MDLTLIEENGGGPSVVVPAVDMCPRVDADGEFAIEGSMCS